jgi:hypothetical protein
MYLDLDKIVDVSIPPVFSEDLKNFEHDHCKDDLEGATRPPNRAGPVLRGQVLLQIASDGTS